MAWHTGKPAADDFLSESVQHIRENFAELEPLQPHVAAILDSHIVDHNLDVADPPNGYYVRWQNGLQIIMAQVTVDTTANTAHMYTAPAAFRTNTPKHASYSFISLTSSSIRNTARAVIGVGMTLGAPTTYYVATDGTGAIDELPVHVAIVGLW